MRIGVGQIGLDVVNGRLVQQVDAAHLEHGALALRLHDILELDDRQSELVWSEGRTCREDAALLVATQTRRAHEWRELACLDIGEPPDQPEVAKPLDTTQGIGIAVLGLEDDGALRLGDQSALARNPELLGKRRADVRDGLDLVCLVSCHYRSFEFGQDMPRIRACFRTRFAIHCEAAAELARKERVLRQSSRPLRMNRSSAQDARCEACPPL